MIVDSRQCICVLRMDPNFIDNIALPEEKILRLIKVQDS